MAPLIFIFLFYCRSQPMQCAIIRPLFGSFHGVIGAHLSTRKCSGNWPLLSRISTFFFAAPVDRRAATITAWSSIDRLYRRVRVLFLLGAHSSNWACGHNFARRVAKFALIVGCFVVIRAAKFGWCPFVIVGVAEFASESGFFFSLFCL